ncbi:hypothetical protein Hanom_Chr14g01252901 [Helianthus anomalus]
MPQTPIGPKDTLGDISYKTYTEEACGDAPHQAPWGLNWRTHDGLYHAYVFGESNTRAANHQIVCEWRTMVKERGDWEKYRELVVRQVKEFEKMKAAFAEEKAKFESDKKSEEWGREGLRGKLRAAEELLTKEHAEWKEIYKKENQRMYATRTKITNLDAQNATLTKKVEDVEADKERVEAELKDLHAKDVEITELNRRLREKTDKSESLEIDLEAERVKAATAEEAKKKADEAREISTSALNVAQNNYAEAQSIIDTLVSESEWLRSRGIVLIANSILNASKLDAAVVALIDASHAVGHCGCYLECAQHAEEAFGHEFDVSRCSVTDQADAALARAEGVYDHLSLSVMDLVVEALKHDDWCQRLKTILDPPQTVELSDEEETAGGDGNGDGDGGDGYE